MFLKVLKIAQIREKITVFLGPSFLIPPFLLDTLYLVKAGLDKKSSVFISILNSQCTKLLKQRNIIKASRKLKYWSIQNFWAVKTGSSN